MKRLNIIVTGEPETIRQVIKSISYGPEETVTHNYQAKGADQNQQITMSFGSLQVDEDHRIDFFGGNDPALFQFVAGLPSNGTKGVIIILDADQNNSMDQLHESIKQHQHLLQKYAMVVGITGEDYPTIKQTEEQVRHSLKTAGCLLPVFSIDAENKADVGLLVETLLCFSNPGIHERTHNAT